MAKCKYSNEEVEQFRLDLVFQNYFFIAVIP